MLRCRILRVLPLIALAAALFPVRAAAATPTNVQFTHVSSATLSLSWTLDDPANQTPYVVLSTVSDYSKNLIDTPGTLGQQTTTYRVADNTTFYFKVKVITPATAFSADISTHNASLALFFDFLENDTKARVYMLAVQPKANNMNASLSDVLERTREEVETLFLELLPK